MLAISNLSGLRPGRMMLSRLVVICMLALPSSSYGITAVDGRELESMFEIDGFLVEASQECLFFNVFLAEEGWQKARGLMFVKSLPEDYGMLFQYPSERRISMYMKNTLIPLDMVFIAAGGKVIDIAAQTTPGSLSSISPGEPALAVLEINGGLAARVGLSVGHQVIYPRM